MHVHKAFRAGFAVIILGAIFVLAMAHVAVSDPASAYNCGDRGVVYCIFRYSYPNSRTSETASLTRLEGGILALGATGIQVNPNDDTARLLKSAIEARTKIKVALSGIPRQAGDLNPTMLVIGTKPTDYNVAR